MVLTDPLFPVRRIRWAEAWRLVAARFPPIDLFERVSRDPEVWEALVALERAANPRARDEIGEIRLVPAERRVTGPGATWVMAPFTRVNPRGSRFSDGSYGVYYAGCSLATALREVAFHFERFAQDSADGPRREDYRCLVGSIDRDLAVVDARPEAERTAILDPESYAAARAFGRRIRDAGHDGVHFPSVRRADGRCIGAFWPDAVGIPVAGSHVQLDYDGTRVVRYFEYATERWREMPSLAPGTSA